MATETTVLRRLPVWAFSMARLMILCRGGNCLRCASGQVDARAHARGHKTFGGRLLPTAQGFRGKRHGKTRSATGGYWTGREWVVSTCEEVGDVSLR